MKAFVYTFLVAACLVACAHGLPGARRESFEDDDFDDSSFGLFMPDFFEAFNRLRQNLFNYFHSTLPDMTNIKIPEGANTTSTTKIIDGHVVTINETTYTSGDENGGTGFRIRIIDVKPQNDTVFGDVEPVVTTKPEPAESAETVEDFNNEISKNGGGDTLTA